MNGYAAVDYVLAREVLQRGIAALYIVAFVSTVNQFRPLLGEHGLLPAPRFLQRMQGRRMLHPTLFRWWPYTDRRLVAVCVVGIVVAATLVVGLPQLGPPWLPMIAFLAIWALYTSIVAIGQTFYSFGWEMLILEAGVLAAFLGSADQPPTVFAIVLFWWLLFRLEFGAGMIKIRGGREWRDLTALMYHHETQPMPNPLSRQAHLLPAWFHRGEVIGNHVTQLGVPWLLFAPLLGYAIPGPVPVLIGTAAASVIIVTQLWLVATGNFAWLNWMTIVVAFAGVGIPTDAAGAAIPLYWVVVVGAVTALCAVLSWPAVRNLAARRQLMNASFNRLGIGNAYGAFGTVTKVRIEYVVEGTTDAEGDTGWQEYVFKGKPGPLRRIPAQFAPYHLRLDWLMWFLPLGRPLEGWFTVLLGRLLDADRPTLRLLARDPFDGERPAFVRVLSYRYRFSTHAQFRETGDRWLRDRRQVLVPPVSLRQDAAP